MSVLHFYVDSLMLYHNMSDNMSKEKHDTVTLVDIENYLSSVDLTSEFIDDYEDEDDSYDFKYDTIVEVRDEDNYYKNVYDDKLKYRILNEYRCHTRHNMCRAYRAIYLHIMNKY